jgi:phytanoyl-CoA hydroxylase
MPPPKKIRRLRIPILSSVSAPTDARREYEERGYVVFRDVLDAGLVAESDAHVDWLLARHPELQPEELGHRLARDDPFWLRLVGDERLLDVAELFVGPDIALFATHYLCKPPRTGRPVLWHQDGAFWPLDPMEVITLWLAITDSDPDNGCLRVIPSTHTRELAGMTERDEVDSVLRRETDYVVDESEAVDLVLRPGDVSVHHPNILHSSNANTSDRWRRALTIRYIPTTTRITDPDAASPFLLRGRAVEGVNAYLERPRFREGEHMSYAGAVG